MPQRRSNAARQLLPAQLRLEVCSPRLFVACQGLSRTAIFGSYLVYAITLYSCWLCLWPVFAPRLLQPPPDASAAAADDDSGSKDGSGSGQIRRLPPDASRTEALLSDAFRVGMLWYAIHQLRTNLYMGTVRLMLLDLGDTDGHARRLGPTATIPGRDPGFS